MCAKISTLPAEDIRKAIIDNLKLRERDLCEKLGISEAELVAANIDHGVTPITPDLDKLFPVFERFGEVMALTRNASAVHEKKGVYTNYHSGKFAAMTLGKDIDMRMFPARWVYAFAVEKNTDEGIRRSFQIFDKHGDSVHKVHIGINKHEQLFKEVTNELVFKNFNLDIEPFTKEPLIEVTDEVKKTLVEQWSQMTDTHQYVNIIRKLGLTRLQAVHHGEKFSYQLKQDAITALLNKLAGTDIPIMCFVGSRGCIQIHSGPINTVKPMGPWINVLDPKFNLHLRTDHIKEIWAVKKPTDKGHVNSIEAYDHDGELIAQFFGKRIEGMDENPKWRAGVLEIIEESNKVRGN